ncbi:MAG: hypothetical protein JF627_02170 [Alphaproteobacteria bacterium]|nr:hypothetical protein [Alphaproteobacteria bacterium]
MPAKAGIQLKGLHLEKLDSRLRGNDKEKSPVFPPGFFFVLSADQRE